MSRFLNGIARWALIAVLVAVTAVAAHPAWRAGALARLGIHLTSTAAASADGHQHAGGAIDPNRIKISAQARWSAGIEIGPAKQEPFQCTVMFPGIVRTTPGRSIVKVPAPLTGIVAKVYHERGEAVVPGQPLFDVTLTHEELIRDQAEFLAGLQKSEVLRQEIARLDGLAAGVVSRKDVLQREYELRQVLSEQDVARQVLLLHRLPPSQIEAIQRDRKLVDTLTVCVPGTAAEGEAAPFQIQEIAVEKGQHVDVGDSLCTLADYRELQIEGSAFESEAQVLHDAVKEKKTLGAVFETETGGKKESQIVGDLRLAAVDDRADPESRTVRFWVQLPNDKLIYDTTENGRRFIARQFKPGQRCRLRVPFETINDGFVVPVGTVAEDRASNWVFVQENPDEFSLRPVRVLHRDPFHLVIEPDPKDPISRRDTLVLKGAGQVMTALRNGGGLQSTCDCGQQH